jgi:hypothetical protein
MRFLYYDRINSIEKGKKIVGVKTFTLSEEFFRNPGITSAKRPSFQELFTLRRWHRSLAGSSFTLTISDSLQ